MKTDGVEDERRLVVMLNNLSVAYGDAGDAETKRDLLEEALNIKARARSPAREAFSAFWTVYGRVGTVCEPAPNWRR